MLTRLRHRGYDSWGVAQYSVNEDKTTTSIRTQRYSGSVPSVPHHPHQGTSTPSSTKLTFSVGHTRYTTRGSHECHSQAQPLMNHSGSIALVHNGQVECDVGKYGTDTKFLLDRLESCIVEEECLNDAFYRLFVTTQGAYACIALIAGIGLVAFRDPQGTRPLCVGCTDDGDVMFASESCAFQNLGVTEFFDVAPGEVLVLWEDGELEMFTPLEDDKNLLQPAKPKPCLFEFIYLAHDDSVVDGISVREAREEMGRLIAPLVKHLEVDAVVPVPHTPVLAGKVLAKELGTQYVDLLQVHSRQARRESRTFILPTQTAREQAVRQKFAVRSQAIAACRGKKVLVLDDSIVRGTTLRHVVGLIRTAVRPEKIYVASLSPPIVAPNRFGIDIPDTTKLIAAGTDTIGATVAEKLAVDGEVVYQSLETLEKGLEALCKEDSGGVCGFEDSVFRVTFPKK